MLPSLRTLTLEFDTDDADNDIMCKEAFLFYLNFRVLTQIVFSNSLCFP